MKITEKNLRVDSQFCPATESYKFIVLNTKFQRAFMTPLIIFKISQKKTKIKTPFITLSKIFKKN